MANPSYTQTTFRGYDDDGVPGSATAKGIVGADWTQIVDVNFRIRYALQETNAKASPNAAFGLEYNLNSGGWNPVSITSSVVKAVATAHYVDGDADNVQRVGSGTFTAGELDENAACGDGGHLDYAGNDECEGEFCLTIVSGDVDDGDTIVVRCTHAYLATWTDSPTITVSEAVAGVAPQAQYYRRRRT